MTRNLDHSEQINHSGPLSFFYRGWRALLASSAQASAIIREFTILLLLGLGRVMLRKNAEQ